MQGLIWIVGLGPSGLDLVSRRTYDKLTTSPEIVVRTAKHPAVEDLVRQGVALTSFDYLYEEKKTFEEVYQGMVDKLIEKVMQKPGSEIVYAVPGHPLVLETSVRLLLKTVKQYPVETRILPAMSFLDVIFTFLKLDPAEGLQVLDGLELNSRKFQPGLGALITQVYNRRIASEVKLTLMDHYPDDYPVKVIRGAGIKGEEKFEEVPLYELDRLDWVDHLTTVYVEPQVDPGRNCSYPLDPLVEVMAELRGPNGCPWDLEQTHDSLKRYLIEESYEVLEAIELKNMHKLCEELGDLLLQVVFHTRIAAENEHFDLNDVVDAIVAKMIRRHPHVFAETEADTAEEVMVNWEEIKAEEKRAHGETKTLMDVPRGLPALLRAEKVQARAAKVGFDWPEMKGAWDKVFEELKELKEAVKKKAVQGIKEELGDALFALVNVSRFLKTDPEEALTTTIDKFIRRFSYIESSALEQNKDLGAMSLDEMDKLWKKAKKFKKNGKNY